MALDDPDLLACLGYRVAATTTDRRQNLYCNQLILALETDFEVGAFDADYAHVLVGEIFASTASRRWWQEVRDARPAPTRRRRQIRAILDEEWDEATRRAMAAGHSSLTAPAEGEATETDVRDGLVSDPTHGRAGRSTAIAMAGVGGLAAGYLWRAWRSGRQQKVRVR